MEVWQRTFNQIDNEPDGSIIVVAGPHNGDAAWATPALPILRQHHPNRRLIVCCPNHTADIFHHNPHIDRLVPVDTSLQRLAILAAESKKFSFVLPPISLWPVENIYNLLRMKQYLDRRGYIIEDITPDLYVSSGEMDVAIDFMAKHGGGPRFMVETFSYSCQSAFNMEWFSWLVKHITEKWRGAWIFVPCSPKEMELVPKHSRVVPLHRFTVRQCGFLVNFCDYMLSCSSGVSHACSSTLARPGVKWLETVTHKWHSTEPYHITGRKYHVGVDVDQYFNLLHELLT